MSSKRLILFFILGVFVLLWSVPVLVGQYVRSGHADVLAAIRAGEPTPDAVIARTIAEDEAALRLAPCNLALRSELVLLNAQHVDAAAAAPENADEDVPLARLQHALDEQLACAPTDGKAWLDEAMIGIYRGGITPQSLAAYRMSARVAPGESWLAEKRLLFALEFRPVFDAKSLAVAQRDLVVLERAHPNRMTEVMKAANVTSKPQLYALFAAAQPKP